MNTTNTEIIPITLRADGIRTVNARSLHAELGVGKDFSNWIKARIEQYDFEEGSDYQLDSPELANQDSKSHGGDRRSKEYHITLDMAKELAMVERTPQGKFWRQYFIRMEKKFWEITRALPQPEEAAADLELPAAIQIHRDQLAYLLAQGVPPATACRSSDRLMEICKKLPGIAPPKHEVPDDRAITIQSLRDNMKPGILYRVNQLTQILPPDHPMHTTGTLTPALNSSFGKYLAWAAGEGLLERNSPRARFSLYKLPEIVAFPAAQTAHS
jgi:anti-repressor protein